MNIFSTMFKKVHYYLFPLLLLIGTGGVRASDEDEVQEALDALVALPNSGFPTQPALHFYQIDESTRKDMVTKLIDCGLFMEGTADDKDTIALPLLKKQKQKDQPTYIINVTGFREAIMPVIKEQAKRTPTDQGKVVQVDSEPEEPKQDNSDKVEVADLIEAYDTAIQQAEGVVADKKKKDKHPGFNELKEALAAAKKKRENLSDLFDLTPMPKKGPKISNLLRVRPFSFKKTDTKDEDDSNAQKLEATEEKTDTKDEEDSNTQKLGATRSDARAGFIMKQLGQLKMDVKKGDQEDVRRFVQAVKSLNAEAVKKQLGGHKQVHSMGDIDKSVISRGNEPEKSFVQKYGPLALVVVVVTGIIYLIYRAATADTQDEDEADEQQADNETDEE